jgi:2,4-dienoyl-CoA reductase-like NADH-dependent reductase (Old Yellow Enzyme family)
MTKLFKPLKSKGVSPDGRISPGDSSIYYENHIEPFANISRFIKFQSSITGIQIANAGRKALTL